MRAYDLERLISSAECRVFDWEHAGNDSHRLVLATIVRGFNRPSASVLCEPSLARSSRRPPDVVLVDPVAGVHVIEVKGHLLSEIDSIEPGGKLLFRYGERVKPKNPVTQVRDAMFDIKNATERGYVGTLQLPFEYWVIFPRISRSAWQARFGLEGFCPPEFLFSDDLEGLAEGIRRIGQKRLATIGLENWPPDQMAAVWSAFGDSSVLFPGSGEREVRRVPDDTLGEQFDEAAEAYKSLSDEQQRLSALNWHEGPRLIRGVAGSGKTIVLANNLARRLARSWESGDLFAEEHSPERLLVVCNNRSLVPFLIKKIELAFMQRTGRPLPEHSVEVIWYNGLMWRLAQLRLWQYQKITDGPDEVRATTYLQQLLAAKQKSPDLYNSVAYDAIYVDEGQDFHEVDFRLLKELCRTETGREPNLYVFYDDAQNLFGRKRPNWLSVGLNVRGGRANVMSQCFRNTRPIVEAAFNVLNGTTADKGADLPTREFVDIAGLEEKGLIRSDAGFWRVHFAVRQGIVPRLSVAANPMKETEAVVARLKWLIEEQHVRPQDILVLSMAKQRIESIRSAVENAGIKGVDGTHVAFDEPNKLLGQRTKLSLSTTASAKGYDAYCVLLASANEFSRDLCGRINFYVGCTRAIEYLEVFGYEKVGLLAEWEEVLRRL